jgi:hypothetical protein
MAIGALVALACTAVALPAQAGEVTEKGFWTSAAATATATVYAPTKRAIRQAGLEPLQPSGDAQLEMVCNGEWNVSTTYGAAASLASATIYQATRSCQPDFGAGGDAPANPSTFTASGATFTIAYEGCRGTGEGQQDPLETDCATKNTIYAAYGTLPNVSGKKANALHISTLGLTRNQIRSLVRSMSPVLP